MNRSYTVTVRYKNGNSATFPHTRASSRKKAEAIVRAELKGKPNHKKFPIKAISAE